MGQEIYSTLQKQILPHFLLLQSQTLKFLSGFYANKVEHKHELEVNNMHGFQYFFFQTNTKKPSTCIHIQVIDVQDNQFLKTPKQ